MIAGLSPRSRRGARLWVAGIMLARRSGGAVHAPRAIAAFAVVISLFLGAGCASDSSAPRPSSAPTVSIPPGLIPAKALTQRSVSVGGEARSYGYYLPATASARPPLLVLVHLLVPAPGSPEAGTGDASTLIDVARDRGIAVATPTGVDFSFNGGTCCGTAARRNVDDLAFLRAVVRDATANDNIDRRRVYLVGFSNGGFLAYRAACEDPATYAGIAVVEGALLTSGCAPQRPTNLLVVHQRGDVTVPFDGIAHSIIPGDPVALPSVTASLDRYLAGARCDTAGHAITSSGVVTTDYRCGVRTTRVVDIPGGGHRFPTTAGGLDGAETITRFLGLDRRRP